MNWVIPCNEKKYDHRRAFKDLKEIDWRQSTNVEEGDIVYIYAGNPTGAILYKCRAVAVDIKEPSDDDRQYRIGDTEQPKGRYMTLSLVEKYPEDKYRRKALFEHGLKTVQGPCKVTDELAAYLEEIL